MKRPLFLRGKRGIFMISLPLGEGAPVGTLGRMREKPLLRRGRRSLPLLGFAHLPLTGGVVPDALGIWDARRAASANPLSGKGVARRAGGFSYPELERKGKPSVSLRLTVPLQGSLWTRAVDSRPYGNTPSPPYASSVTPPHSPRCARHLPPYGGKACWCAPKRHPKKILKTS